MPEELPFIRIRDVAAPVRAHFTDAGIDLFVPNDIKDAIKTNNQFDENGSVIIAPGESVLIASGLKFKLPPSTCLKIDNKSGVASKKGLLVGATIIDESYQGEVHINLWNVGNQNVTIQAGDKIAQAILYPILSNVPYEYANEEELYQGVVTDRAEGGFGSSGTKA